MVLLWEFQKDFKKFYQNYFLFDCLNLLQLQVFLLGLQNLIPHSILKKLICRLVLHRLNYYVKFHILFMVFFYLYSKVLFLEFHYFYDPFIVLYKYQLMIFFYFLLILQDFNYNHLREFSNHRHKAISFVTFIINYKLNLTKNYLKEKLTY